jgi:hypothetical protein
LNKYLARSRDRARRHRCDDDWLPIRAKIFDQAAGFAIGLRVEFTKQQLGAPFVLLQGRRCPTLPPKNGDKYSMNVLAKWIKCEKPLSDLNCKVFLCRRLGMSQHFV